MGPMPTTIMDLELCRPNLIMTHETVITGHNYRILSFPVACFVKNVSSDTSLINRALVHKNQKKSKSLFVLQIFTSVAYGWGHTQRNSDMGLINNVTNAIKAFIVIKYLICSYLSR